MNKILIIAAREFMHNLRRPAFLFAVFGTPIIMALSFLLAGLTTGGGDSLTEYRPVGYVDASAEQVLERGLPAPEQEGLFVRYDSVEAAQQAALDGEIPAFIELPENYVQTGRVNLYTVRAAPSELYDAVNAFLLTNLAADASSGNAVKLLIDSPDLEITVLEGGRRFDRESVFFITFLPVIFGFLLILSSTITSQFLMSGLVEEKTNRIMEILITSVRPLELLTGKVIGMGALGLMQVLMLLAAGVIGLSIAQRQNVLTGLSIPLDMAVLAIVYYLLSYFLLASIGASIGAIVGSEQESRQWSTVIIIPVMLPYILFLTFLFDPNGPVPTLLSLIPFTAPMAVLMRVGLTTVPLWQIAFSMGALIVLNLLVLFLSARMFRWGILSYGKTPGLRRLIQIFRGRAPEISRAQPQTPEAV